MKKKKRAPAESERINLKISMKNQFKYYSFSQKLKRYLPKTQSLKNSIYQTENLKIKIK
jgi:hypothetical protein